MTRKTLQILSALLFLAGCGGSDYEIRGTGEAVGLDGKIAVETADSGNRRVRVDLEHVPPPGRVARRDDAQYIVWFVEPDGEAQKAGFLDYDQDARTGHLEAITTLDRFRVLVTAEGDPSVRAPTGVVVAQQNVNM